MSDATLEEQLMASRSQRPGGDHYRAFVGPPAQYDFMGATQFRLLTMLGLREENHVLDLGCGSLRAGRLLIAYLLPNRYCGLDPNTWLIEQSVENEIGADTMAIKQPQFSYVDDFDVSAFDRKFDFVIAQSIFSHTSMQLMQQAISNVAGILGPSGQFLFTALTEDAPDSDRIARGKDVSGWVYPKCVGFAEEEIVEICRENGLFAEKLDWFHPRQTWFRCVREEAQTLSSKGVQLDSGRVFFDARF